MNNKEELGYRLECMLDEYIIKVQNNESSRKPRFSQIISSYSTPKKFQRDLMDIFSRTREEIACAIKGTDLQCTEAWSFLTQTKLKKIEEYLNLLIEVLENNSKITRKKRKIDPSVAVRKLKFKSMFKKIESVDPEKIIGATHFICYNTKYKKISYYYSNEGFGVKGTTLQNFDKEKSLTKNIGRSKMDLKLLKESRIEWFLRQLSSINSKTQEATGRINSDTLLLKVVS